MADANVTTHDAASTSVPPAVVEVPKEAWPALWALVLGFFMILVDMTIVSVATPAILETYAPNGATVALPHGWQPNTTQVYQGNTYHVDASGQYHVLTGNGWWVPVTPQR